jgi:hypothetical protein
MTNFSLAGHRLDVHDAQSDDQENVVRVQAAVFTPDADTVVISDWFDVADPGDDESYDDALADACEDARGKLVSRLADEHGISRDDAWDLVDNHLIDGDMPTPR